MYPSTGERRSRTQPARKPRSEPRLFSRSKSWTYAQRFRFGRRRVLRPGARFPDLDLPDHTGHLRLLSELANGDPVALFASRGWWCPKEQRYLRGLAALQDEFEVAYAKLVVVSVDAPETQSAFRAGLGARFTFLSDHERRWLDRLGLARRPTPSMIRTSPPPSPSIPISASTPRTTATGTGAARRRRSYGATCARSRWRFRRIGACSEARVVPARLGRRAALDPSGRERSPLPRRPALLCR